MYTYSLVLAYIAHKQVVAMHCTQWVVTSVRSMHCFCRSLAVISMRGLPKTYLQSLLMNSASSKKQSSMPWKAVGKAHRPVSLSQDLPYLQ